MDRHLVDTYRHKGLRKKLIDVVRKKGITDENVLEAMNRLPRHYFLDPAFLESAYEDKAFQIGKGQTISQPFTVAYQTQLLGLKKRDKVLEIGTGSGYQASVLAYLGAKVFSIERHKQLYDSAKQLFLKLKIPNIKCFYGDGFEGVPAFAPYDKILITAAAPEVPQQLLAQLKVGGILVIPFGKGKSQEMQRILKAGENTYEQEHFDKFKFVPMLKGKEY